MNLTLELLTHLQDRLEIGNRNNIQLNAFPGKSKLKFDVTLLNLLQQDKAFTFLKTLFSEKTFSFKVQVSKDFKNAKIGDLQKTLENIYSKNQLIKDETGEETFGFGYLSRFSAGARILSCAVI